MIRVSFFLSITNMDYNPRIIHHLLFSETQIMLNHESENAYILRYLIDQTHTTRRKPLTFPLFDTRLPEMLKFAGEPARRRNSGVVG
ncbi:hypothetical protein Hdeb2414_s0438g00893741 [Helianthus debilis subsp. tardiflorus]